MHPVYPTNHLARTLKLEIDAWEVYLGKALRMLPVPPYNGIVFPLVSKLSVVLYYTDKCEEYHDGDAGLPCNAAHNIGEFVRRVKQMAPTIGTVVINARSAPSDNDGKGVSFFGDLLSQLFEIAETTAFSDMDGELGHYIDMALI
ncbi:hypothetical protein GGI17_004489 [Coemansia sp. S146]|nr:hypothetical protein GGI17_004489 [Coemansia sp. S146]